MFFFPPAGHSPCLAFSLTAGLLCLWSADPGVVQLSAAVTGVELDVSAAESEGATSLLDSTESSCKEAAASCTASLSSETQRICGEFQPCFYTEKTSEDEVLPNHYCK